ncbi:MAG: hypothetical protein QNJ70_17775 [Xenococcaceae cyanobacterium MO_207.B15]|nr:hypothetical protein [Xenococcaceae cyanobacterium MO_207.B15]MDJ0743380.1 hypothetical protein [Xenococcaceae cyanobacterium MO_167.B27]
MMFAFSLCCLGVVAIAIYLSTKIKDEVFKVGMGFTALAFSLVVLICAPWTLKLIVAAIPLVISALGSLSVENFRL